MKLVKRLEEINWNLSMRSRGYLIRLLASLDMVDILAEIGPKYFAPTFTKFSVDAKTLEVYINATYVAYPQAALDAVRSFLSIEEHNFRSNSQEKVAGAGWGDNKKTATGKGAIVTGAAAATTQSLDVLGNQVKRGTITTEISAGVQDFPVGLVSGITVRTLGYAMKAVALLVSRKKPHHQGIKICAPPSNEISVFLPFLT
jgi:hypothetical protein